MVLDVGVEQILSADGDLALFVIKRVVILAVGSAAGGGVTGEDRLTCPGGVAGLRGVGLVGDDGVAALFEAGAIFNRFEHIGKGLDRHDDYRLALGQGLGQLLGLGALAVRPTTPSACSNCEMVSCNGPSSTVVWSVTTMTESKSFSPCWVGRIIEGGELVCGPGDGVGFAGAGAMLHQIFVTRPFGAARFDQALDDLTDGNGGRSLTLAPLLAALPIFLGFDLQADKAPDDLEQVGGGQHLRPEIGVVA